MQLLKKITVLSCFGFFLLFSGCDTNSCQDILCPTNQVCYQGNCFCQNGFEGIDCFDYSYQKYIGNYNVTESCLSGFPSGYTFGSIQWDGSAPDLIVFVNFLNLGYNVYGRIYTNTATNAGDIIEINENVGGTSIFARGSYNEFSSFGQIVLDVEYTQFNQANACTLTFY